MDSSVCAHGGIVLLSNEVVKETDWAYTRTLSTPEGDRTWQVHTIPVMADEQDVYLVIGNSGVHAPTSIQVAKVAAAMTENPQRMREIETIGLIARRGVEALLKGDFEAVGRAMIENQVMLKGLGVSCPELGHTDPCSSTFIARSETNWSWWRRLHGSINSQPKANQ